MPRGVDAAERETLNGQEIYRMSRRALGLKSCSLIPVSSMGTVRSRDFIIDTGLSLRINSRTDASRPQGQVLHDTMEKSNCDPLVVKSSRATGIKKKKSF